MSCILIDPQDPLQIDFVVERLREDLPVGMPTETVYGLAGLASSEVALARIFELKARPHFDPLIVHVLDEQGARPWIADDANSVLHQKLTKAFWPGPLTLLFRKSEKLPDLCTAGTEWVAIRSPAHPVFRQILERLEGLPLAAPSANRFASISPTSALDVVTELGPYGLEAVVQGGSSEHGLESTVVKVLSQSELEILRPGALSLEALAKVLGPGVHLKLRASGSGVDDTAGHEAPGQHRLHYAPSKPLHYVAAADLDRLLETLGISRAQGALMEVFPSTPPVASGWGLRECLSDRGDWSEAAAKLFSTLRALDADSRVSFIVALECSSQSLGLAISDRLRRASAKTR
jgi:L-threonylcarbamoyladenylate synthase